tara:strand:+ start:583 stop:762 length:180 start_codon:yes stop_codon:yes gene_type:complete
VPPLFDIIGDFMNDKEPKEIKQGFDIPYPELNAPSVKIGGDAVKVEPTEEPLKESWKKI